jgi:hypothetical protein
MRTRDAYAYLDDDDDLDVLDRYDILPDGFALRTKLNAMDGKPITEFRRSRPRTALMDSRRFDAQNHQPGFRLGDAAVQDARSSARAAWVRQMSDAWKRSPPSRDAASDPDDDPAAAANAVEGRLERERGADPAADLERDRRRIHAQFSQQLENAWRGGR